MSRRKTPHSAMSSGSNLFTGATPPFDAAIDSLPTSPESATEKMAVQRMMPGFRLHVAPHTGDTDRIDPMHGNPELPGVLDCRRFDSRVKLAS